jgi:hypothetical protein
MRVSAAGDRLQPPASERTGTPRSHSAALPRVVDAGALASRLGNAQFARALASGLPITRSGHCAPTIQRTMLLTAGSEPVEAHARSVLALLARKLAVLPEDAPAVFERLGAGGVTAGLTRLLKSSHDYGSFDLASDQSAALLYYELAKHDRRPRTAEDPETEIERSGEAAEKEARGRADYRRRSPDDDNTYDLVFVGAGAATAYYLESAGSTLKSQRKLVIGPIQPWAAERGPGVINHPMHMISPRRDTDRFDGALAPRAEFSRVVEEVLEASGAERSGETVKTVKKIESGGTKFYEVVTATKTYYARKVVAGLGIGPHDKQGQDPLLEDLPHEKRTAERKDFPRAMDLDTFQRQIKLINELARPKPLAEITVVISGANAGIDAVMTAIRNGYTIVWITGSGRPGLLPGTDNEYVEAEYEQVIKRERSQINRVIKGYGKGARTVTDAPKPLMAKTETSGAEEEIPADYYVYAMGPDVKGVSDIFDKRTVRDHLVPTYDRNRQFGAEGLATVVGLEVENESRSDPTSLEIIGGSAYRMAGLRDGARYDYLVRHWHDVSQAVTSMAALEGRFTGMTGRDRDAASTSAISAMRTIYPRASAYRFATLRDAIGMGSATAARHLTSTPVPDFDAWCGPLRTLAADTEIDRARRNVVLGYLGSVRVLKDYGAMLAEFHDLVTKYLDEKAKNDKTRMPDPRGAAARMGGVIGTLPNNVLINDQLTPIRSQVHAQAGYVPGGIASGGVNFATDSGTVLAIYIAANFPFIPDTEVDVWVDRIVRWRRPGPKDQAGGLVGPLPNPLGKSREDAREFGEYFERRLREENEKARRRRPELVK